MELYVSQCVAWAPGIETSADWSRWAKSPERLASDVKPAVKAVPAMTRRRLTRWGRMSLEVASACVPNIDENTPCIFASRHGDTHRTLMLLKSIAEGEALSPTAFSLSVHNSSVGIFSIVHKIFAGALAVAGGKETLAEAFVAAYGLLSEGHKKVLLVQTDEPIASFYENDVDEAEMPHAVAMVLTRETGQWMTVDYQPATSADALTKVSLGTEFLRFWFGAEGEAAYVGKRLLWRFATDSVRAME